ncbi:hypothetical protein [Mesorhizobium sp.]|uniref:hypothetical protein n=1 Tax=Mesorhizobium sp. TaxID=1871066 RepID=UPI000FE68F5D|nr:hypothetical protein [Mesorhizobium sp.]RWP71046.1 MAG: hypothetical protein EOR10_30765 [Mesorhizobium sp.]
MVVGFVIPMPPRKSATENLLSQKIQERLKWLLTVWTGADYIRLTNEGGAPLATKKFASRSALCEIQESRVSDTRTAPSHKRTGHDTASAMSVL